MNCLKCGKETAEGQVFCPECQEIMAQHPVKPGTAIHLPQRDLIAQDRRQHDKARDPANADTLPQLRRMIHWLTATIAVLSVLLLLTASMLIHILSKDPSVNMIGRNYTTSDSANQP